jgi:hypothetical protein
MSARVSTHFVLRLADAVMVATVLGPSPGFADALTPESGGSANADVIDPQEFASWAEDQRAAIQRAGADLAAQRERREGGGGR